MLSVDCHKKTETTEHRSITVSPLSREPAVTPSLLYEEPECWKEREGERKEEVRKNIDVAAAPWRRSITCQCLMYSSLFAASHFYLVIKQEPIDLTIKCDH